MTIQAQETITSVNVLDEYDGSIMGRLYSDHLTSQIHGSFDFDKKVSLYNEKGDWVDTVEGDFQTHKFTGLRPGTYYVYFHSLEDNLIGHCPSNTYYGEWYGGSSTFEDATPIVIEGDETVWYVDGRLRLENPPPSLPQKITETRIYLPLITQ